MRWNEYFELTLPEKIGAAFSSRKRHVVAGHLTEEMRDDMCMSFTLGALAKAVAAAVTAHGVPVGPVVSLGGKVAEFLHLAEIGKEATKAAYEETVKAGYGASRAAEATREWFVGKSCAIVTGPSAKAVRDKVAGSGPEVAALRMDGAVVVLASRGQVNDMLREAGAIDGKSDWTPGRTRLERAVGPGYPVETAPTVVDVNRDGWVTAYWRDLDGRRLRGVTYDGTGAPTTVRDFATGEEYPADEDPDPFFRARRAVVEDFKDGLVRCLMPHDSRTHLAVTRKDGTILVRCLATGKVDNPEGPAVRLADGRTAGFRDGVAVRVSPGETVMEPIAAAP